MVISLFNFAGKQTRGSLGQKSISKAQYNNSSYLYSTCSSLFFYHKEIHICCGFLHMERTSGQRTLLELTLFVSISAGHPSCVLWSVCSDRPIQSANERSGQCGAGEAAPEADWHAGLDNGCTSLPCRTCKYLI